MKSRKTWIAVAAIIVLAAGGFYLFGPSEKTKAGEGIVTIPAMPPVNELPDLAVQLGDQSTVYLRDLSGDILLIFFNPDCDHCQEEARDIAANKTLFENWQVYFITSMEAKLAEEFAVNYRLTEPNYKFGHAGVSEVFNSVGTLTEVPTIIFYRNNRFIRKFEGLTSMEQLKEFL
jgi:thiol-disulfide isomerase/thioredoxin